MPVFEKPGMKATLSLAAIALSLSATSVFAEEPLTADIRKVVVAKLLILPGDDAPAGLSDVNSPAREISLDSAFVGSSSHNAEKTSLDTSKSRNRPISKRKSTRTKKQRVRIARTSIPQRIVKRRAPLIMGVYR